MYKTVQQTISIQDENLLNMMKTFKCMVNDCIKVGLENKKGNKYPSMKMLSGLCYSELRSKYDVMSYYVYETYSIAAGILKNREHSEKRKRKPKNPFFSSSLISAYMGFKIVNEILKIPLGNREYFEIKLNKYVVKCIKGMKINSFSLFQNKLYLSYSDIDKTEENEVKSIVGLDRNLDCITIGNKQEGVLKLSLKKPRQVVENTRKIIRSVRSDKRIQNNIKRKYGKRQKNRVNKYLHKLTKYIVDTAKTNGQIIVLENLTNLRDKHTKESNKNKTTRFKLNSLSFREIQTQIIYKAAWAGVPIIQLSRIQTMYTSQKCHKCGELTQYDQKTRLTYCEKCDLTIDRDVLAAMNIAEMGRKVFYGSKGVTGEAKQLCTVRSM